MPNYEYKAPKNPNIMPESVVASRQLRESDARFATGLWRITDGGQVFANRSFRLDAQDLRLAFTIESESSLITDNYQAGNGENIIGLRLARSTFRAIMQSVWQGRSTLNAAIERMLQSGPGTVSAVHSISLANAR